MLVIILLFVLTLIITLFISGIRIADRRKRLRQEYKNHYPVGTADAQRDRGPD